MSRRMIARRAVRGYGVVGFRAFGWQFDYRRDGAWLPFSIRYGHRRWHILRLGRLGMLTAGPVIKYNYGGLVTPSEVSR